MSTPQASDAPHSFSVGSFHCHAIRDGGHLGSTDVVCANAPAETLAETLVKHGWAADQLRSSWTCLLIDTGKQKLLVDTGMGSLSPAGNHLPAQLAQLGLSPNEIDLVFLSHCHPDHIGGCTDEAGQLIFADATYIVGQQEFDFWTNDENLVGVNEWLVQ